VHADDPCELALDAQSRSVIATELETLSTREAHIVRLRFGLSTDASTLSPRSARSTGSARNGFGRSRPGR
jgi:DNA-directed RNA polymerase sigma subunit (sigma70/sigma32)